MGYCPFLQAENTIGVMLRRVEPSDSLVQPVSIPLEGPDSNRRGVDRIPVVRMADLQWKEQLDEYRLPVRLLDRSPGGMGLSLPQELPVGLIASVRWEGGAPVQAVVRHCRPSDAEFVAGLMHLPVQRRSEDRKTRHQTAKLVWDDLLAGRMAETVRLLDVSSHGFRCHSQHSLPVPLVGCLATPDWQYYGTTRYCVESESGYMIGFQLIRADLSVEPGLLLG